MQEHYNDYCFYYNRYWPVHQQESADICSLSNPTEFKHEKFLLQSRHVYVDTKDGRAENKIRASVNAIISWIGFWLIVPSGACGVHERESQKRICRLMVRSVFWIMFNLGIQDTMTVIIKDWKCEWNWNASQEKQNLYIPTKLWLISLKDWEIIAFQRLEHIYIKCKSNSALSCVIGERHCSPKCCWKHGFHP